MGYDIKLFYAKHIKRFNLCGVHPVALPMIRYKPIIYTMYITYNSQLQPTILTLFSLILSLHVSAPTDHLQVTIPTSFDKIQLCFNLNF
jgi:hypothetical protein